MAAIDIATPHRDEALAWRPPELAIIVPSYNEACNIAVLFARLTAVLGATRFELIVVDDNSPDGTAALVRELALAHPNVRGLTRIGRRGLSSAVVEGMASTAAPLIAVIDADLQHDESILPAMLERARAGDDIVVGSRYLGEAAADGLSAARAAASRLATRLARLVTGVTLTDPMSGFFLIRRAVFDAVAPSLSRDGFKVLLDIIVSATQRGQGAPRISEVPYRFRPRHAGESKMGPLIVVQFLGLLLSRLTRGVLPTSFLLFALVGGSGVFVHLATLWLADEKLGLPFAWAQFSATLVAMTSNFVLNNELTYADKKLRGWRALAGLATFCAVCSFGTLANVSVATLVYNQNPNLYLAGIVGALMSVVFNYAVTRVFTWR